MAVSFARGRARVGRTLAAVLLVIGVTIGSFAFSSSPASAYPNCTTGSNSGGFLIATWPHGSTSAYFRIGWYANSNPWYRVDTIVCYRGSALYDWWYG